MSVCRLCNGTGRVYVRCEVCGGSGRVMRPPTEQRRTVSTERCYSCHGTGRGVARWCPACQGTGEAR